MDPGSGPLAPYWRFSKTLQLSDRFGGGTYTALIVGCDWDIAGTACEHCWSRGGWSDSEPRRVLDPAAVVDRLDLGRRSLGLCACRITGGEPTLYWEHVYAVAGGFLERTAGQDVHLVIETHGATLNAERIAELDFGPDACRLELIFGIKATSPELLALHTGMDFVDANRTHRAQLQNLALAAGAAHLKTSATFIDRFTEPDVFSAIAGELPGVACSVIPMQIHTGWKATR